MLHCFISLLNRRNRPSNCVRTGYDYVELRVTFKEDLHPFYPPTIALVRPRLHGRCLAKRVGKTASKGSDSPGAMCIYFFYLDLYSYVCRMNFIFKHSGYLLVIANAFLMVECMIFCFTNGSESERYTLIYLACHTHTHTPGTPNNHF